MKKLLKPSAITFILLMLVTFMILGLYLGRTLESGKGHGLAGGAIVLGWGVLTGGTAFISSFFIAYHLSVKKLVKSNWILLAVCLATFGHLYYLIQKQAEEQHEENNQTPTAPVEQFGLLTANLSIAEHTNRQRVQDVEELGMGYFKPNFHENDVLYFYGNPNLQKALDEHSPYDSITFGQNELNQTEITTAPPWLVPEIMKLDYDILYFKVLSVTQDFAEVVVNTHSNQTAFVSRISGHLVYWPDFLMGLHSVEFFPDSGEKIQVRPFTESGTTNVDYEFMRAVRIKENWMEVILLDGDFKEIGKGWIQWQRDNKLLVMFNLLS